MKSLIFFFLMLTPLLVLIAGERSFKHSYELKCQLESSYEWVIHLTAENEPVEFVIDCQGFLIHLEATKNQQRLLYKFLDEDECLDLGAQVTKALQRSEAICVYWNNEEDLLIEFGESCREL